MLRARIKPEVTINAVYACHRRIFRHDTWLDVPAQYEQEARAHPMLEVEEVAEPDAPHARRDREKGKAK